MKKNIIRFIALFMAMLLGVTGCSGKAEPGVEPTTEAKEGITIGMSLDSFIVERWRRDCDVFVSRVKEIDSTAEVNVQNANGDIDVQKSQIRYLIEKKVDVLVIVAIDSGGLSDVVAEANQNGIPVIAYDRLITDADVDLYISFDNEKVGSLMGEALIAYKPLCKKVLMLSGPYEDHNVSLVENGFRSVMERENVEIVDCFHAQNWRGEEAADYMSEHQGSLRDLDAIMCGNDNIATNAIRTLSEMRLAGKIGIVGQDADLEACQHIVEGTQIMTVYKPVEKLAQAAAEYAMKLAEGEEIETDKTINDGSFDVPYYCLEPIAVTRKNIDSVIIDSGFHLREDVYLNVNDD